MFNKFTERARKVILLAKQEAKRFNHDYIGTEHLLLGLIREGEGVAAAVLQKLGLDLETIRLEVEKLVQPGPQTQVLGDIPFTPRSKKALELSAEEARALGHNYIGTEHLLLGLIREGEGVADVLLGRAPFTGKLPVRWPRTVAQLAPLSTTCPLMNLPLYSPTAPGAGRDRKSVV